MGGPDKPSFNRISPCVVGADEGSELLSFGNADDARPSVPADVVESADLAVFPANEQERLVSDFPHEKIPRVRDLIRATDVQPAAEVEPLELFMERRLVPEGFPRQQGRGREVFSGFDVHPSFRNVGLLHRFRGRYSEDSFGVFAANDYTEVARSRHHVIALVESFNPTSCARVEIAGLSAHRGGSASPWVANPSEAVPSVSSHLLNRGGRKNSCRSTHLNRGFPSL